MKHLIFMGFIFVCGVFVFILLTSKRQSLPIYPPKNSEKVTLCSSNPATYESSTKTDSGTEDSDIPTIYFIIPT